MRILKYKKDIIRKHYLSGEVNVQNLAEKLQLTHATIRLFFNEFKIIQQQHPDKLHDFNFSLGKDKIFQATTWYNNFEKVMPGIVLAQPGPHIVADYLYEEYHKIHPDEFSRSRFYAVFKLWFDKNLKALSDIRLKEKFTAKELATLRKWRKGNDRRLWQVAVVLMTVYTYHSLGALAERIETTHATMLVWMRAYKHGGLEAVSRPGNKKPIRPEQKAKIEKRMDDIVHMVRQSPKLYNIDKASWTLTDLAYAYSKFTGQAISFSAVSTYLKKRGVKFRRSREVIVSNDPQFREKYDKVQEVLSNLGKNEKFFSIDEYGPRSIRPYGGRQFVRKGELAVYQKVEKGKGFFICTCALELSTNQLSWFYSTKKNTNEIIKLIEVLTLQYQEQERLYLLWDAASWHDSKELWDYLAEVNEPDYRLKLKTPEIIVVPLPSKTPHLNVIESVFSGMSRSVIHNSDYNSVEECKAAIDRYFNKRNEYFLKHPKRAGDKIWGKEKVKPVFNKANICRNIG